MIGQNFIFFCKYKMNYIKLQSLAQLIVFFLSLSLKLGRNLSSGVSYLFLVFDGQKLNALLIKS